MVFLLYLVGMLELTQLEMFGSSADNLMYTQSSWATQKVFLADLTFLPSIETTVQFLVDLLFLPYKVEIPSTENMCVWNSTYCMIPRFPKNLVNYLIIIFSLNLRFKIPNLICCNSILLQQNTDKIKVTSDHRTPVLP